MTPHDKFNQEFEALVGRSLAAGVPAFHMADVLAHTEFELRMINYDIQKRAQAERARTEKEKNRSPLILPPGHGGN